VHKGRVVKRTGGGAIVEFRSAVDAVRCAMEVQSAMVERNAGVPEDRRVVFRIGIHIGDVVEEADGDLMGDGVNIAARLEGIAKPGAICLSEDACRQVKGRLDVAITDLGQTQLKNLAEPIRVYSLQLGVPSQTKPARRNTRFPAIAGIAALVVLAGGAWYFAGGPKFTAPGAQQSTAVAQTTAGATTSPHLSIVVLPFANLSGDSSQDYFADGITENLTTDLSRLSGAFVIARNTAFTFKGKNVDVGRLGRSSARAMCWRARCRGTRPMSGSMRSWLTRRAAVISGPSASTSPFRTSSACKTRSSRVSPADWARSWSPMRPGGLKGAQPRFDGSLFSGQGMAQ
jgi:adenylate cyclase